MIKNSEDKQKAHPMMTRRDFSRHGWYQRILKICINPTSYVQMASDTKLSTQMIGNYCRALLEDGYLSISTITTGKFRQKTMFYTTVKVDYPLESFVPMSIRLNARMKAAWLNDGDGGTKRVNSGQVVIKINKSLPLPTNVTVVKERHVKSNYKAEFCGIGSSMGMTW